MKLLATLLICVWALLEPPYKNAAAVLNAPLKQWTVARYNRDGITLPYYFDTYKDCEERRNRLSLRAEKVCLPVNPATLLPG